MTSSKVILAASLGSALLGGLSGGWLVTQLTDSSTDLEREPRAANAADGEDGRSRRDRGDAPTSELTRLETRIAELEGRIGTLHRRQRARAALQEYADALATDEDSEDGEEAKKPRPKGVVDAEDPTFDMAVRTVMDRIDWEKGEERRLQRQARQERRASRQTQLLVESLELSDEQAEAVAGALGREMQRFRALRNDDGENGVARPATRGEWRERITEIRGQTEEELREVLDEDQLKGYRAFAEEEGFGPRRWNRRGRREDRANSPSE